MKKTTLVPVAIAAGFAAMTLAAPAADAAVEAKGSVSAQSVHLTAQKPSAITKKKVKWLHASAFYDLTGKTSITRVCVQVSNYKSTRNCGPIPKPPVSGAIGSKDIKCGKKGILHGVQSVAWFENKHHEQIGDKRKSQVFFFKC